MKFLVAVIVALGCLTAEAKTPKIRHVKGLGAVKPTAVGDTYAGPFLIGRLSPFSNYQVELTGMLLPDQDFDTVARNVKGTMTYAVQTIFDPMDPGYSDEIDNIMGTIGALYDIKRGCSYQDNGSTCQPISKYVSIVYDPAAVVRQDLGYCLGKDLEVADQGTTTEKYCYTVMPTEIIFHSL